MRFAYAFLFLLMTSSLLWTTAPSVGETGTEELESAANAWGIALSSNDADAMASRTTDDFMLIPPNGPPAYGREAAHAVWRKTVQPDTWQTTLTVKETAVLGDTAYRTGEYSNQLPNGTVVKRGMFIDIWRKVGGDWLIHRHMYSVSEPTNASGKLLMPGENRPVLEVPERR